MNLSCSHTPRIPSKRGLLPIAIAARELGLDKPDGLVLHVAIIVETVVSERHLEYLYDLVASWRELVSDKLDALFREMRELSSGPLRTQYSGFCFSLDFSRFIDQSARLP